MKNQNNDRFNFQKNINALNEEKEDDFDRTYVFEGNLVSIEIENKTYPVATREQFNNALKHGCFIEREDRVIEFHTHDYKVVFDDVTFEMLQDTPFDLLEAFKKNLKSVFDTEYLKKVA